MRNTSQFLLTGWHIINLSIPITLTLVYLHNRQPHQYCRQNKPLAKFTMPIMWPHMCLHSPGWLCRELYQLYRLCWCMVCVYLLCEHSLRVLYELFVMLDRLTGVMDYTKTPNLLYKLSALINILYGHFLTMYSSFTDCLYIKVPIIHHTSTPSGVHQGSHHIYIRMSL